MAATLTLGRAVLRNLIDWWLGELRSLVPRRLRAAGRRDRPRLVLRSDATRLAVSTLSGPGEQVLEEADASDPAARDRLRAALSKRRRRSRAVTLRLDPALGLRRRLDMPLAAEADLHQALSFEMDRITPFKAEEVLFAHRVTGTDRDQRRISIELDVVPRATAAPAFEIAESLGLEPQRLELAGPDGSPGDLDLMPREGDGTARTSRLNGLLLLLLVALAVTAAVLPLQRQRQMAAELAREVEEARVEAEKSIRLRDELEALERSTGFVASTRTAAPMTASVLAELTRVIPDQAYVTQLRLQQGDLQIHGLADTASELIGRLAASPMFDAPQFRSPVTRDPRTAKERFHIQVMIAGAPG